jgi:hypothetical protein
MMIAENNTARNLIDAASSMRFGSERDDLLKSALSELGIPGGAQDDIEARAVAMALLAESDSRYLPEAERALTTVRREGAETNWISLHLVDAYYIARDYKKAITHARRVDQSYFDAQDLHWRSVKVMEILAASLLAQGALDEGLDVAMKITSELANRGGVEEDDLMPPSELMREALELIKRGPSERARQVGHEILADISSSIDLNEWFPKSLVNEATKALESFSN